MRLTPDGARYLRMGSEHREPLPFHLRWLLPAICRENVLPWMALSWVSAGAGSLLTGLLARQYGASDAQAGMAALLWLGLPSVRFATADAPVLVDMPGMALAVAAAVLAQVDVRLAMALALLAGCAWERAPIFAAAFALEPWLLVGLAAPALRWLVSRPAPVDPKDPLAKTMTNPLATGLAAHAGHWRNPAAMALPWGACLAVLAALPSGDLAVACALALGLAYAQLLVATDTVRLYQQAAPVVCVAAALAIPPEWALPLVVAHWLNPWAGNGV